MAFSLPTFNLMCGVFRTFTPPHAPDFELPCNLAWGKRVNTSQGSVGSTDGFMTLLLPAGSDIRSEITSAADIVEVPVGTKRFYRVFIVDDIGKGFENEHRAAILLQTDVFGAWPTPIP